ncbi:hypothetical protein [Mycolicibacterium sp. XJ870]
MTEQVAEHNPDDDVTPDAEDTEQSSDVVDDDSQADESPNQEAAKYRKRLRETEAERDQLAERVEALQRQQIDAQVLAAGVKPAALWKTAELTELLAEDGTVSADLVAAAIATARDELGIQPIGKGAHVPSVGNKPDASPKPDDAWTEAFRPSRK